MKTKGIIFSFLYCPPEQQREFNYWHDNDHIPEYRALPGMFHAQRYSCPERYNEYREIDQLEKGAGNLVHVYFTENELTETMESMKRLGDHLVQEGRIIKIFRVLFHGPFRVDKTAVRPGRSLDPGAVPVMPHLGAYFILDEVYNKAGEQKLIDWYDKLYLTDVLKCQGIAAVIRFYCLRQGYENRILHYFFLDDDPLSVAAEMRRWWVTGQTQARSPSFSTVAHRLFAGPYQVSVPLQYTATL